MRKVIINLPLFLAARLKMASVEMKGEITEENFQAVYFIGIPVIRESDTCLRCGRAIQEKTHREYGYGPDCFEKIQPLEDHKFEGWLPKSKLKIYDIQDDGTVVESTAGPKPDTAAAAALEAEMDLEFTPRFYVKEGRIHFKVPMKMNDAVRSPDAPSPRFNSDEKTWSYPATPDYANKLMSTFYKYKPEMDADFEGLVKEQMQIERSGKAKTADDLPPIPITKTKPWKHQLQAFWFAKDLVGAHFSMDMGTGKTKTAIDVIMNNGWQKILIICPAKVVDTWPKEFTKHTDIPIEVIALGDDYKNVSAKVEDAERRIAMARARKMPYAVVISYDSCWRPPFGPTYVKQGKRNVLVDEGWAKRHEFECIVCDEAHKIKDPNTKASQFAAYIRDGSKQRLALTGTPMPHDPLDVFGQFRFLNPKIFGDNFTMFKRRYAITPKSGPLRGKKICGFKNQEELNEKFYSIAFRVESKDVLDLPPVKTVVVPVSLSKKALKHYVELERQMYTELENGPKEQVPVFNGETGLVDHYEEKPSSVSIKNALTKMLRLQQITSGYLVDDEKHEIELDDSKEQTLMELLDGLPSREPVVVFCNFTHDLAVIKKVTEKLGRRYGEVSGQHNDLVAACMPEDKDVLGVQIKSGGAGVDLTRAAYGIYYSPTVNLGDYLQSLKRMDRPGQTRPVTFYQLIASRTVDVKIYKALDQKQGVVEYVLGL